MTYLFLENCRYTRFVNLRHVCTSSWCAPLMVNIAILISVGTCLKGTSQSKFFPLVCKAYQLEVEENISGSPNNTTVEKVSEEVARSLKFIRATAAWKSNAQYLLEIELNESGKLMLYDTYVKTSRYTSNFTYLLVNLALSVVMSSRN